MPTALFKPPHPRPIFSLVPANNATIKAGLRYVNKPYRSMVDSRVPAFTIALTSRVKRTRVLATIGGANANIRLWRDESWIQCSFELHPDYNGYIMLHDHSDSETQESGEEVQPFEPDRPRQIVVQQGGDMIITVRHGFEVLIFNVVLHTSAESMAERLEALRLRAPEILRGNQVSPPSPQDLVMPDREECMRIRYSPVKFLGSGGFGTVQRCINVDTGKLMAVKTSSRGSSGKRPSHSCALAREIETLGALSHQNIVQFIGYQEGEDEGMEIFMDLKDGNAEELFADGEGARSLAKDALVQILRAPAYLDRNSLVHGDVKLANILYSHKADGTYQFFLADFGVSNWVADSYTFCGTPLFQAPEIWKHLNQTPKVDIWSLFVSFLWIANIHGFRTACQLARMNKCIWEKVEEVGSLKGVSRTVALLHHMGAENPHRRPSASESLRLLGKSQ